MKDDMIRLRVSSEDKEQIRQMAEADNRTISNYILNLIKIEQERFEKEKEEEGR